MQKRLLLLGFEPCTTCKYVHKRRIYGSDRTHGVYIRSAKTHVRSYGYGRKFPCTDTVIRRIQIRRIFVCTILANPTVYTMYIWYFKQGNHHTYGHIWCVYAVLANPRYSLYRLLGDAIVIM